MCPFSVTSDFVLFFQKYSLRRVFTTVFNNVNRVGPHVYLYDVFHSVCHVDINFSNTAASSYSGKQSDYREYSSKFVGGPPHSNALYRICKLGGTGTLIILVQIPFITFR